MTQNETRSTHGPGSKGTSSLPHATPNRLDLVLAELRESGYEPEEQGPDWFIRCSCDNEAVVAHRGSPGFMNFGPDYCGHSEKIEEIVAAFGNFESPAAVDEVSAADGTPAKRTVTYTRASAIKPRPVHWLWSDRIALGTLALLAGREGIGKSTIAYDLAARVTRGTLEGRNAGQPKSVAVVATEDSWEHTIVPRLMGANADLDRVLRVDVVTAEGNETGLSLPRDLLGLEHLIQTEDVALVLLDPLMSRLGDLDTHKDADVRQALEPLVAVANRTRTSMLGLIHLNKSSGADPLTLIMGSRAFAAVARAVLFAMKDNEDESKRYLGQPKNNLGRTDLPTLGYSIEGVRVADTDEGPVYTGRVAWGEESSQSIRELLEASGEAAEANTAMGEAAEWLTDYLKTVGGKSASAKIKREGKMAGHSESALKRASRKLKLKVESVGMPRETFWSFPDPK